VTVKKKKEGEVMSKKGKLRHSPRNVIERGEEKKKGKKMSALSDTHISLRKKRSPRVLPTPKAEG